MNRLATTCLLGLLAALSTACVSPHLIPGPLVKPQGEVGQLYAGKSAQVTVAVQDDRPKDAVLGGGVLGPNGDEGKGIFLGYVTEAPGDVAQFMEATAKDTVAALGLTAGPAVRVEVRLKDLHVAMYRYTGFSPMNCIGYVQVATVVPGADGTAKTRTFKLTYFENTTPMMSMKEITKEAVSRIILQATREALVVTLLDQFPQTADPAALEKVTTAMRTGPDNIPAREQMFWLALAGRGNAAVKEGVIAAFRTHKEDRVRQGAAEAIGMLGLVEQKDELLAVLAGTSKVAGWDNADTEQVWYLLKALHLLGVPDLPAKIPNTNLKGRVHLTNLVEFLKTGTVPPLTAAEAEGLAKARQNGI